MNTQTQNIEKNTEDILLVLNEMNNVVDRLTSGNVSHLKASLKWAINELKNMINE